jgi:serine/threonine protein kinase
MIGRTIASYRILEKLGEGGMGVVYKAVDIGLDRLTAVKVLSADFSKNAELVERFRAEAKAQANLNHTNLATLYAFLVQDGTAFMVMEFVDGETFEQMIRRRGPIPEQEAIPMFRQALLGIGYAHRAGIIHRDIKPSNLMLNKSGIVKVMDFGIAKVMGSRGMTRTGTQMGTVAYMSPEQIQNRPVDHRSDIYELGVTLYEMLTGHLPFESDSDFQVMQDHVSNPPPPPSRFYPYVSKGVERVILKSLEKNPDARFQTVEEFGAALEHPDSYAAFPAVTTPERPAPPPRVPQTPSRPPVQPAPPQYPSAPLPPTVPGSVPPTVPASRPPGYASQPLQPTVPQSIPPTVPGTMPPPYTPTVPGAVPAGGFTQPTVPAGVRTVPATVAKKPPAQKKIIIGIAAVALAAIAGVVIYQMNSPVPTVITDSGGGSGGGAGPQSPTQPSQEPGKEIIISGGGPSDSGGVAAPPVSSGGNTAPPAARSQSPGLSGAQMYQRAETALQQHRYFEPTDNSALYWAIQARKAGSPQGKALEDQILEVYRSRMKDYIQKGDYRSALGLVQAMLKFYPGDANLLAAQKKLQAALAGSN